MNKNLYVGNLSKSVTEDSLREIFAEVGDVSRVRIITSGQTGRPRTYGFVEMASEEAARMAIARFNGQTVGNRAILVSVARFNESRSDLRDGQISYGFYRRRY